LRARFALGEMPDHLEPRYNIAPSQPVLVIPNRGPRRLRPARWGLVPHWAADPAIGHRLINARAETLATRPAFRDAVALRRCLIPADGFYEWQRAGGRRTQPFYVRRRDGSPFAFAGLWDVWRAPDGERIASCTIVTTDSNALLAPIHDRMPVILDEVAYDAWLDPRPRAAAALEGLLVPFAAAPLEAYPVSTLVNTPANDDPQCIAPLA